MACRRRALLLASLALAIRRRRRHQEEERKPKRRFWVRKIFSKERKERGECENLFRELGEDDREYYFKYIRMSPERFEHLFSFVAPFITKQDTNYTLSSVISFISNYRQKLATENCRILILIS